MRFALELLPSLGLGLLLGRLFPGLPARLAPPLITWGVPISLVGLLLRSGLRADLGLSALAALLAVGLGLALLLLVAPLWRIQAGSLQLGAVAGNTAYWGLPVALALLPPEAIAHTITYDLVGTLLTWSLGPLLISGTPTRIGGLLRALRDSPASSGLAIALLLQATPWQADIASWLWWPARAVVLVALALVGMRLSLMLAPAQDSGPAPAGLGAALAVKLLLLPALVMPLTLLLGLPPMARDALVLQAAAPSAISVLLLAEAAAARGQGRQDDAAAAAALVLWSTLIGLLSVPLWWGLLQLLPK